MKKCYLVIVCLFFSIFFSYSQSDCSTAIPVCVDVSDEFTVRGPGNNDFLGRTSIGCLGLAGAVTIESNSYWFRIKLTKGGQFGFDITPNNTSEDWDFAVFGPNANCGELSDSEVVKCNVSNITGNTGVGNLSSSYEGWMDVSVGEEYFILINNYSGTNDGFKINWTGDIFSLGASVLDCEIDIDFGDDDKLCTGEVKWLSARVIETGYNVEYNWYRKNNLSAPWEQLNLSTSQHSYLVEESGIYMVIVNVYDLVTGALIKTFTDDIEVEIIPDPTADLFVDGIYRCDDGTGNANFVFDELSEQIIGSSTGITVSFYDNEIRAKGGLASSQLPTDSYVSSGGEQIWVRVTNDEGCRTITSFDIIVSPNPTANKPSDLIECDLDVDGKFVFDLEVQTELVLGSQTGFVVSYYTSQTNAELGKFEIFNLFRFNSSRLASYEEESLKT